MAPTIGAHDWCPRQAAPMAATTAGREQLVVPRRLGAAGDGCGIVGLQDWEVPGATLHDFNITVVVLCLHVPPKTVEAATCVAESRTSWHIACPSTRRSISVHFRDDKCRFRRICCTARDGSRADSSRSIRRNSRGQIRLLRSPGMRAQGNFGGGSRGRSPLGEFPCGAPLSQNHRNACPRLCRGLQGADPPSRESKGPPESLIRGPRAPVTTGTRVQWHLSGSLGGRPPQGSLPRGRRFP